MAETKNEQQIFFSGNKAKLLAVLDEITDSVDEKELEHYRKNLRHL